MYKFSNSLFWSYLYWKNTLYAVKKTCGVGEGRSLKDTTTRVTELDGVADVVAETLGKFGCNGDPGGKVASDESDKSEFFWSAPIALHADWTSSIDTGPVPRRVLRGAC